MKILYIDTSSSYLYAGIVNDDELLIEVKEEYSQKLSEYALPKIASMFEKTNIKPGDIQKIIVVNGPGSFTGIRIGLTIAKVYAWSLNIPITTITSLEAMACVSVDNQVKVPIIDARRGYYYVAIYDGEKIIQEPIYMHYEKLQEILNAQKDYVFITNDDLILNGEKCTYSPDILNIVKKFADKEEQNPHYVNPEYLKLTEAEESKQKND